ncbi:MAG: response regulator [Gaiellales bacterium]
MKTDSPVTVMVVEDDDLVLRLLCNVLRRAGHRVVTATDGMTALSTARRELPDVVVVDILLPAGNGLQLLERMRSIADLSTTAAVVMTGGDPETYGPQAEALGAIFLPKPLSPAELLSAVESALKGSTSVESILGLASV